MKKLSAAVGIAAISLMSVAAHAQSNISDPLGQPSGSTSSGMPADVTPGSPSSPGLNNSNNSTGTNTAPGRQNNDYGTPSSPSSASPSTGTSGSGSGNYNYGNSPSSSPSGATGSGASGAPYSSSSAVDQGNAQRDPSLPAAKEQVRSDAMRAMRLDAINQGDEIAPQRQMEFDRAQRFLQ